MNDAIYLVLDMINDLIHADGPNGQAGFGEQARQRRILENTGRAIGRARAAGVPIGFVRVGFSADYRECPPDSPIFSGARAGGLFRLGTWGTEVHADLDRRLDDFDIVKHRVSPFYATSLEAILRAQGIRRIFCSGVSTNAVVQATVRDGHDRDYRMVLLQDCCCAASADEHDGAIRSLQRFCSVTSSQDVDFR